MANFQPENEKNPVFFPEVPTSEVQAEPFGDKGADFGVCRFLMCRVFLIRLKRGFVGKDRIEHTIGVGTGQSVDIDGDGNQSGNDTGEGLESVFDILFDDRFFFS